MDAEYISEIFADGNLPVPSHIKKRLKRGQQVRVKLETVGEDGKALGAKPLGPLCYSRQSISKADVEAIVKVLQSDWLTGGPKVREFEEALANYCGTKYCVVTSSGTSALHIAALALDIGHGDIALTPPLTFMASANCILYCGGRPLFIDIDPDTLCLSPELVETYCKKNGPPKVVIPVDFAGVPADMPGFGELAEKYGFKIIEDAAHATGSSYTFRGENHRCGSCVHSDLSILSFHAVKNITTGEGGAVLTNDDTMAKKLRLLANHGIERDPKKFIGSHEVPHELCEEVYGPWYHEMQILGYNYRITDFQCALGLSQMSRLNEFKERRKTIVKQYNEKLKSIADEGIVRLPPWPENTDPFFHLYVLQFEGGAILRHKVFMGLRKRNIYSQVHYIPVHVQPYYRKRFGYKKGDFPNAESYYEKALSIPIYAELEDREIDYIVEIIKDLIQET